jgi:hypothetical protein
MKSHADPHYYDCAHPDSHGDTTCDGKMRFHGNEPHGKKQAVYKCSKCGRLAGESMLLYDYGQMKMRD